MSESLSQEVTNNCWCKHCTDVAAILVGDGQMLELCDHSSAQRWPLERRPQGSKGLLNPWALVECLTKAFSLLASSPSCPQPSPQGPGAKVWGAEEAVHLPWAPS